MYFKEEGRRLLFLWKRKQVYILNDGAVGTQVVWNVRRKDSVWDRGWKFPLGLKENRQEPGSQWQDQIEGRSWRPQTFPVHIDSNAVFLVVGWQWSSQVVLVVKNSSANAVDGRFDPWVGKIPWRRAWRPTPVSLPGEAHRQRSLVGCSPWGLKESDTTEAS